MTTHAKTITIPAPTAYPAVWVATSATEGAWYEPAVKATATIGRVVGNSPAT